MSDSALKLHHYERAQQEYEAIEARIRYLDSLLFPTDADKEELLASRRWRPRLEVYIENLKHDRRQ